MDPKMLNPGFQESFALSLPHTPEETQELWKRLPNDEWSTYTSTWTRDELGGVYGLLPWLPDPAELPYPTIHVGAPLPAGTRGYRGANSNLILHDLRDRMALSLFNTYLLQHKPGEDQALNQTTASALAELVKSRGYEVPPPLLLGNSDQAERVTLTVFDTMAYAVAATASPRMDTSIPKRLLERLEAETSWLPFALGLAQMWRRQNPNVRGGQVFSRPRDCIRADLFMAAHETAHMFARETYPAPLDSLRTLAGELSAPEGDGLLARVRQGARHVVHDDHKWEALASEVSADYAAHLMLMDVDPSGDNAGQAIAYQGAVAWLAGCRALGSTSVNLDRLDQAFEQCGASLLRLDLSLIYLLKEHSRTDLVETYQSALAACIRSWGIVSRVWIECISLETRDSSDHPSEFTGRHLGEWGSRSINSIWNSWWSPVNRHSMQRASSELGQELPDFLNLP